MAQYILLADIALDANLATVRAGTVFDTVTQGTTLDRLRDAGAALVEADDRLLAILAALENHTGNLSLARQVALAYHATTSGSTLRPDENGTVHLYTSAAGDDANDGTSASPLLTWQAAFDRYAAWLKLGLDADFHLHLHAATVTEAVRFVPSAVARGRLRVTGDMPGMTQLATGTVDAVATTDWGVDQIEDADATFGTARALIGFPVRVWDPLNEAATEQWSTVADHDNTHLAITGQTVYHAAMQPGWSYEVMRPASRIDSSALAAPCLVFDGLRHSVRHSLDDTGYDQPEHTGGVIFEFIEFIRTDDWFQPCTYWRNGAFMFVGCVWTGIAQALVFDTATGSLGGVAGPPAGDDAFLGLSQLEFSRYSCGVGVRRAPFGGIPAILAKHSNLIGYPVVIGTHSIEFDHSIGGFSGGAIHAGDLEIFIDSWCRLYGMLIKDTPANHSAIEVNPNPIFGNAYLEIIGDVVIDGALADAISVGAGGRVVVQDDSSIITGPGGIAGRGIVARWGGVASFGPNTTDAFTTTGDNIDVDGQVGTFAGLTEGAAVERAGYSGARVYRAEVWS